MSFNTQLADLFEDMARLLEVTGANAFRVNAYRRGARRVREYPRDLRELAGDLKALTAIEGIGKGLATMIDQYAREGRIEEYEQLKAAVPPGLTALMDLPGVGPKTAAVLWQQAGVTDLASLKAAIDSGRLADLPRMGPKSIEKIRQALAFAEQAGRRVRLGQALPLARQMVEQLRAIPQVCRADYAGSLRRGRETVGDVDLLVAAEQSGPVVEHFVALPQVAQVLLSGPTKTSVRTGQGLQVDLRIVHPDRYGAALAYFTGSKQHNVALRQRAIDRGLRLNEYGLWPAQAGPPDGPPLAGRTEQEIYQALGLAFIEPELREDRGEIAAAEQGRLPRLVGLEDITAELHAHTVASDGAMSIEQLAEQARRRRFHTVAVTDHSASQPQANGLDAGRLEQLAQRVRRLDRQYEDLTILAGTEVDILPDGSLDYPDSLLAELDLVIASAHAALNQRPEQATTRLLKAIENPYVHILGHPTGRLIGRREGLKPDMARLIRAAAQTGTAMELNANPWRLDLCDVHLRAAVEAGVMIAINTDAHGPLDFDLLGYGILTARRGWVEPGHVVNCMSAAALKRWLGRKRERMGR